MGVAREEATPLGASPGDLATVEAIVLRAGTSFHHGMRILPAARRQAMYAIYAFCRLVDDVADEDGDFAEKQPRLERWRARVDALFSPGAGAGDSEPEGAVCRVLARASEAYALRREDFVAVIDGMAMDASAVIVAPSTEELDLYCDRVAAAVGRLSVRAFGDASPDADEVAHALGRALQLTNILRDLAEDAGRGRLYLPRELLDAHAIPCDPQAALASPRLPAACRELARVAQGHFKRAASAMRRCDRRAMRPARLMGANYAAVLAALERSGWRDPARRVRLSKWRKLLIAARAFV